MDYGQLIDLIIRNNPQAVARNLYSVGALTSPNITNSETLYRTVVNRTQKMSAKDGNDFILKILTVPIDQSGYGAKELLDMQTSMNYQLNSVVPNEPIASTTTILGTSFSSNEYGFQLHLNWSWNKLLKILGVGVLLLIFIQLFRFTFFSKS